ncbi:hypothetical protein [Pseudaquabacterium pictum]|uniref:Uncharacterized protein n=1 Tax=Pseudaquabacterium pictum TaxID=2315236 RepID=A0A480AQM5_9BURK|nr:hypothetical protein [Rubrivivax pictus]GCL62587.1 hypothetical protein AQPW35_16680 [Rubrivivax pictus]
MWHYLTFLPCGVALFAQVALSTGNSWRVLSSHTWKTATALWLGAWIATLLILYGRGEGSVFKGFVLQREAGYWLGSAVMLSLPFIALAALRRFMFATPQAAPSTTRIALGLAALVGWLLSPGLFGVGWVAGCVFAGYPSCM